jgi:subtilisin family serine protease
VNSSGDTTTYNLLLGGPSNYTSAGYRRDGVIKPDISAPARYTISSLSSSAKQSMGGCPDSMATGDGSNFTLDGLHVAWEGTSAATPFTAGVIALMLQKNPNLDAEQIRQILKKTAKSGGIIGAVPNQVWGWGMINPAAALTAVPSPLHKH